MTRASGITYAKRRCNEFRQLLKVLKNKLPDINFPQLPPKKLPGAKPSLEKRPETLQNFLNFLLIKKIYTKSVHKFLAREHEVPIFLKEISKKDIKRGKGILLAAPSPSIIEDNKDQENPSVLEIEPLNLDTLQRRYTTYYKESEEDTSSYNLIAGSIEQNSTIKDDSVIKKSNVNSLANEVKIEELKTGLMDAIGFMARVKDVKMQRGKFVFFWLMV